MPEEMGYKKVKSFGNKTPKMTKYSNVVSSTEKKRDNKEYSSSYKSKKGKM